MTFINIKEAQEKLRELVGLVATKQEDDITITIDGEPTVTLTRYEPPRQRIGGLARGKFIVPSEEEWRAMDEDVAEMFGVK